MNQAENTDPINLGEVSYSQPIVAQPVALPVNNSNLPSLQNQNQSFIVHTPIEIEGLTVPEPGHIVYVKNEPGQAAYVYKAEVLEYPHKVNGRPRFEFVKVKILQYIQPVIPSGSQRQRLNTEQMVSRRFVYYEKKSNATDYEPIAEEKYQAYLDKLNEENPAGGRRPTKKSAKKRKSLKTIKRKLRHKSKSHKRRNA
jgi:hypothetical protein